MNIERLTLHSCAIRRKLKMCTGTRPVAIQKIPNHTYGTSWTCKRVGPSKISLLTRGSGDSQVSLYGYCLGSLEESAHDPASNERALIAPVAYTLRRCRHRHRHRSHPPPPPPPPPPSSPLLPSPAPTATSPSRSQSRSFLAAASVSVSVRTPTGHPLTHALYQPRN